MLQIHHIAGDAESLGPLVRDLGGTPPRPAVRGRREWAPLPVQYVDYTLWQREWLGQDSDPDSAIATQMAYWKHTLADLPEQLNLPTDRPRPAGQLSRRASAL